MTALLELNNIRRSYPSGDGPVEVLKGISLRVEADLEPYTAGQFTRLGLWLPDALGGEPQRVAHAYSFVNPPNVGYHEFYVVLIPDGRLTPYLQRLQVGDGLWLARQAFEEQDKFIAAEPSDRIDISYGVSND